MFRAAHQPVPQAGPQISGSDEVPRNGHGARNVGQTRLLAGSRDRGTQDTECETQEENPRKPEERQNLEREHIRVVDAEVNMLSEKKTL